MDNINETNLNSDIIVNPEVVNAEAESSEEVNSEVINAEEVNAEEVITNSEEDAIMKARNSEKALWYALHTFTGYEYMVKENLELVIEKYNLQQRIFDIIIPEEETIEEKKGKRKVVIRKLMPGYVLVKMIYEDDIWHAVTRTRGITGFVGPKGRPLSLTEEEVRRLKLEQIKVEVDLKQGDKIEITAGPLEKQIGTVISIDLQSQKVRAAVNMFGRDMPVDLTLIEIRKI